MAEMVGHDQYRVRWDSSYNTSLHNVVRAEYLRCIQNLVSTIYVLNGQYPTPFIFYILIPIPILSADTITDTEFRSHTMGGSKKPIFVQGSG